MKRYGVALLGAILGGLVGWALPLCCPFQTINLTSAGPEAIGHIFQFFGLCLGGAAGFLIGSWAAVRYIVVEERPPPEPLPPPRPRRLKDDLE